MGSHQVVVDWTRCDGHGLCSRLLPERMTLDEWGFPVVDPAVLEDDLLGAARLAARSCPALALRVEHGPDRAR
jgi:ferredoxin